MSLIANIEIAIAIPIFTKKIAIAIPVAILKKIGDPDLDRSFAIADLFSNLFNCWSYMFFLVLLTKI